MAATYKLIEGDEFNPRVTTLEETLLLYGKIDKPNNPKAWGATIRNNKFFKPYLKQPLIELFKDGHDAGSNPLALAFVDMLNKARNTPSAKDKEAVSSRRKIYSLVGALQFNLEKHWHKVSNDTMDLSLLNIVVNPDKPSPRAFRYTFNVRFLPKYLLKLAQYAADNPEDKPVARAIMFQIFKGFRPGEVVGLVENSLRPRIDDSASSGIATLNEKMSSSAGRAVPMNVPLGPIQYAIIQQALEDNRNRGLPEGPDNHIFVKTNGKPVTTGDMTRVTRLIKVPGILTDYEPKVDDAGNTIAKGPFQLDTVPVTYFWRNFNATLAHQAKISPADAAADVGRMIGSGGGEQVGYISPEAGFYTDAEFSIARTKDLALWDGLRNLVIGDQKINDNYRIDLNTDLIKTMEQAKLSGDVRGAGKFQLINANEDTVVKTLVPTQAGAIQIGDEKLINLDPSEYSITEIDDKSGDYGKLPPPEKKKRFDYAWQRAKKILDKGKGTLSSIAGLGFGTSVAGLAVLDILARPSEAVAEVAVDATLEKFFMKLGSSAAGAGSGTAFLTTVARPMYTGEKDIDVKTGFLHHPTERPPSEFMTDEAIKKAAIMDKSYDLPLGQEQALMRDTTERQADLRLAKWREGVKEDEVDTQEMLRMRNQPVQSGEEQSFLSEGQQQLN